MHTLKKIFRNQQSHMYSLYIKKQDNINTPEAYFQVLPIGQGKLLSWLLMQVSLSVFNFTWMESYGVYSFVSGSFLSTLFLWDSPMLLHIVIVHSFSRLCDIPRYRYDYNQIYQFYYL